MNDIEQYLRKGIQDLMPYLPGKSEEEIMETYHLPEVVKLASNESPLPPPGPVQRAIAKEASRVHRYPDGKCRRLAPLLARFLGISSEELIFGNGAEELIFMICQTFLNEGEEAVLISHCFDAYETAVRVMGGIPEFSPLTLDYHVNLDDVSHRITSKTKLIYLPNPNNPTGTIFTESAFHKFIETIPKGVLVVLDEAYHEYATNPDYPDGIRYVKEGRPVIVLRTFSKAYGLAGLRIGYAIADKAFIEIMHHVRQPFNVNRLAEAAACTALEHREWVHDRIQTVEKEKAFLYQSLEAMNVSYVPSQANFILVDVQQEAECIFRELLEKGVIVRPGNIWGFNTHIRVTIGTHSENVTFLKALEKVLEQASL